MYKLNENRTIEKTLNLSTNPTSTSAELVFIENTLEYGLFQVIYTVDVLFNKNDRVNNSIVTLVEIVPTGFIVATLADGMDEVKIGSSQNLALDPLSYSYDLDELIKPSSLSYKFYCRVEKNLIEQKNFTIDLMTYQKNSSLLMNKSIDCFDSPGKLIFQQANNFFLNLRTYNYKNRRILI